MRGSKVMTYLSINSGKAYFLDEKGQFQEIDKIRKEDILRLLDYATSADVDFKMDEMESEKIKNEAHKIIYENLYRKFNTLLKDKNKFLDESENLYKAAMLKYSFEEESL